MANDRPTISEAIGIFRSGDLLAAETMCRAVLDETPEHSPALHLLALIATQTGHLDDALALLDRAIDVEAFDPSLYNSRGSLLLRMGRVEEAEAAFGRSIELNERLPEAHANLGNARRELGKLEAAENSYRAALAIRPESPEFSTFLATTLRELGRLDEAEKAYRQALSITSEALEARYRLADLLAVRGRFAEAEVEFRKLSADVPSFVPAQAGLAHALFGLNRFDDAIEEIEAARRRAPGHPVVERVRRLIQAKEVPSWHVRAVNDRERNCAYDEALRRAVTADDLVLDVGTGSGLIAMMAARAGAKAVVTCESNPTLARIARETVARNGFAERVAVVSKRSTELAVGLDLPEKADVLVNGLINLGLLAPGMLTTLQHARAHLLKPEARIIPARATVFAALLEAGELAAANPLREIEGFDMSAFDSVRAPGYQAIDLEVDDCRLLSEPAPALAFDFTGPMAEEGERAFGLTAAHAGTAHGVAFWFNLDLGNGVVCSSASRSRTNHWKQAVSWFAAPIPIDVGMMLTILARYDANQICFGLAG